MNNKASGGKKHRKHSRSKLYCEFYKRTHRREKNKVRGIVKHLGRFPDDGCAKAALERLSLIVKVPSL